MYASIDFPTKRDFRRAVRKGELVVAYSPIMEMPAINGVVTVDGPWPLRHSILQEACPEAVRRSRELPSWQARCVVKDMRVVEVH